MRQQPFNQALDRLQNFISYAQDFENGGEERAYALYVLARNGRAPIGELRYYVDTKLDDFSTPLAQAQLGAALAMVGDKARAETALQGGARRASPSKDDGVTRGATTAPAARRGGAPHAGLRDRHRQGRGAAPRRRGRQGLSRQAYTSTQEQAWMLLAARALGEEAKATPRSPSTAQPHKGQLIRAAHGRRSSKAGALTVANDGRCRRSTRSCP